jgi:hypothetical protein
VKAVEERDELFASSCVHRKLQCSFDCFSAAVRKVCARGTRDRNDLIKFLCELRHVAVVVISAAHVDQLFGLLLNCSDDFGVAVAGRTNGDAGVAVEEDVSVNIFDPHAAGPVGYEFECRPWISRVNVFVVGFDNLLCIRAR